MKYRLSKWSYNFVVAAEKTRRALIDLEAIQDVKPPKQRKHTRRSHNLFCDCRKCLPSFNTYIKKLQKV